MATPTRTGQRSCRQQIWEALRKHKSNPLPSRELVRLTGLSRHVIGRYLAALDAGGYLTITPIANRRGNLYLLARDTGIDAPRLDANGQPILRGQMIANLWRTMRMLPHFTGLDLQAHACTDEVQIATDTVRNYLLVLHSAGYLVEIGREKTATGPGGFWKRYRLIKNTGPRPPQICALRTVYDANLGRVMWQETPDELD